MPSLSDIQFYLPVSMDFVMIIPQLAILAFMLGILLLDLLFSDDETRSTAAIAVLGLACAGFYSLRVLWGSSSYAFNHLLLIDNYGLFFNALFCGGAILAVLISARYIEREGMALGEYYVILLGAVLGMMIMASAGSLITVFVGIETLSISLYALAGFNREKPVSGEAAIKYLLLGSFATGFLLYGIALIYGTTGSFDIITIGDHIKAHGGPDKVMLLGAVLILIGFSFKASLAPFHMWAPDVYQGAPTPIAGFMSTAAKAAAFAVLFRVLSIAMPGLHKHWHALLYVIAIITMIIGNLSALGQGNIKRMLAYSSIAHAGYLVIAILAAGRGEALGAQSILFYLIAYTLMNMGAFGVLSALARRNQNNETVDSFAGIGYRHPAYAAAMTLFLVSLAGVPPTAGFFGKFYIFLSAVRADMIPLAIIGVLNAVVSVFYYLRVVVAMYMQEPGEEIERDKILWWPAALAIGISAAGIIAMGLLPGRFINLAASAILSGI
jgi:NADH-quinone oxidoreductase subunit N